MAIDERVQPKSFWRDFVSGLAGPSDPVPMVSVFARAIAAAQDDVVARCKALGGHVNVEEREDRVRFIATLFDSMGLVVPTGKLDGIRMIYRQIERLAAPATEQSPPFLRLGRMLDDVLSL